MPATHKNIILHFVWTTSERLPLISRAIERRLHRMIQAKAGELGCNVIAVNGMPDHIHLLVQMPTTLSPADLMQNVKGASSGFTRRLLGEEAFFAWQHGYGVFSVGPNQIGRVAEYIRNQKQHHATGEVWSAWETIPEERHGEVSTIRPAP